MDQLAAALDALAAEDLTPLFGPALLDRHGFRVERQPDGRWRTWRPDGTEILIGPQRTGPPLKTAA